METAMRTHSMVAVLLLVGGSTSAEVKSKFVDYKQNGTPLQGFLAWDDASKGKRPGVLVVHEWWGHNQHVRNQALRLAKARYVAFALDMYGKGKVATHPKDAQAFMTEAVKDPKALDARFKAALNILKKDPRVDPKRIGAIGYCFGGAVALGEARQGADLQVVASFHGALKAQSPAKPGSVKGRILVMTGEADPTVPSDQVEAFRKEMTEAGARFEIVTYPGAKHGFTNPDADKAGMEALAYNADADQKSWAKMLSTFQEVFGT
jgi:dienelactone hydrolase